jgi:hypothetical protein
MKTTGEMPKRRPPWRTQPVATIDVLAMPPGTVLRADDGVIYERFADAGRVDQQWYQPSDEFPVDPATIALPARVLYRPYYAPWDD